MNKLRLDIDALVVESFDSLPTPAGRGTILGNSGICPHTEYEGCNISGIDPGCAVSDNDGTCYVSLCGQPGCGGPSDGEIC